MRRLKVVLVAAMMVPLAGCVLGGKPKTVAAAPAPPAAPEHREPLSIPQTRQDLPAPQAVNPDALITAPPETPRPPASPPAAPPARPTTHVAPPPKPADSQPTTPVEPSRPPIQEILPADELKRLEASVEKHLTEIRSLEAQAQKRHRLTADERSKITQIDQYVKQSDQAKTGGDMRSADEFAEKANILAKELQGAK